MVDEQHHLQDMRLADQYNRALRERSGMLPPDHHPATVQTNFYRAYEATDQASTSPNGMPQTQLVAPSSEQPNRQATTTHQLSAQTITHVRSLLNQGYRVGLEHVDQRRFRTNAWKSCATVQSTVPEEAIASLEHGLLNYPNEYVRLIGIDPKNKQRVLEHIIQRPESA